MSDDEILVLEKKAMERWRNGDPWGFVELSADDLIYIDVGLTKPIVGLDSFKEYMSQFEGKINFQRAEFIDPAVVHVGDAVLLTYNFHSSVLSEEGEILGQTPWNATEVFFRRNGQWKIVHTHWSYIHHQLTESVEVPVAVSSAPVRYEGLLDELMALEAAAMKRWRQGDPWGFIEISDPGVTYFDTDTSRRLNGRPALRLEYQKREGKIFYDVMDFIDPQIRVLGDMAVLTYRFLSTVLNDDGSIYQRTPWHCTEVFLRKDEHWWIIHTHWSLIQGVRKPNYDLS
jgi:ketosteroid isomerase-like protein